jgi:hypothetical protein
VTAQATAVYANTWRAVFRLLNEEPWPTARSAQKVKVFACSFGTTGPPAESILMLTEPGDDGEQDWAPFGEHAKNDSFVVTLEVATMLPHATWLDALARLEELTSTIEQIFHRTNRTAQRAALVPELAAVMKSWSVVQIVPQVVPMASGKFGAGAQIRIQVEARIKPTSNPA